MCQIIHRLSHSKAAVSDTSRNKEAAISRPPRVRLFAVDRLRKPCQGTVSLQIRLNSTSLDEWGVPPTEEIDLLMTKADVGFDLGSATALAVGARTRDSL
jgi:hypothetical protein